MSKLSYTIHLGNDKNKTKRAKESKTKNGTTLNNNAIQNANSLSKVNNHNLRKYQNDYKDNVILVGTDNLIKDVKSLYFREFEDVRINYNNTQTRNDRKITNYFNHINESNRDLACEIILELGDMNFWYFKDKDYKYKMIDVYNEQLKDLKKILPEFKIANAVVHFDELSPHVHIVGVPVKDGYTNGMKKQVAKSQIFTRASLTKLQDTMRVKCLESFNKIYNEQLTLKEKQQGKGFDEKSYNRKDMIEVLEMERENKELLNKANKKVDDLNSKSTNITTLLNELEPTEKNNCIISKDDVDYITEYIKETKEATSTIKNINSLDSSLKKIDKYLNEYDTNKEDLVFENKQKDKIIYSLNRDLNVATKTIYALKDKIKILQEEIFKFKSFFKRITGYFRSKILFKHDKATSSILDDMKTTNTISTNEYEHIVYGKKLDIEDKNKDKKEYLK